MVIRTECDPLRCWLRPGPNSPLTAPGTTRPLTCRPVDGHVGRRTELPVKIAVVVGNPKPGSRTLRVASKVAHALDRPGEPADRVTIDLAEVASELFDVQSDVVPGLLDEVASSDLVISASPTYKATYTGLLKAFLDRYGSNALAATVAVPVMTGAAPIHALAPEVFLRPLLIELGASVPSRGLFVTESELDRLDEVVADWALRAQPLIDRALRGASPPES
jgi:FMN reductase